MFASSNWIHRKMFFISNSYLPTFFSCLSHLYLKCFLALGTNIFKYLCESFYFGNLKMIFVKLVVFLSASLDPKDVLSLNLYNSLQLVLLNFLSFSLLQALTWSHAHFAFHFWVLSNFRNMKYRKAKMNFKNLRKGKKLNGKIMGAVGEKWSSLSYFLFPVQNLFTLPCT